MYILAGNNASELNEDRSPTHLASQVLMLTFVKSGLPATSPPAQNALSPEPFKIIVFAKSEFSQAYVRMSNLCRTFNLLRISLIIDKFKLFNFFGRLRRMVRFPKFS
jgi:hypothetical protein